MARGIKKYKNDVSELKVGDVYYAVEVLESKRTFGMFTISPVTGRKVVISEIIQTEENPSRTVVTFSDEDGAVYYSGSFASDTPNWHLEIRDGIDLYSNPEQAMYVMRPKAMAPVEEAYKKLTEMQIDIARDLARASVEFGLVEPNPIKKTVRS